MSTFTQNFPALTQKQADETARRFRLQSRDDAPRGVQADARRIRRALLVMMLLGVPVLIEHVVLGMWGIAGGLLAAILLGQAMRVRIRTGGHPLRCGEVALLGVFGLVVGGLAYTGGFRHAGGWLVVLPVAATVMLGRGVTLRWAALTVVAAVGLFALDTLGWSTPRTEALSATHVLAGQVGAVVIAAALLHVFVSQHRRLHERALATNRDLQEQRTRLRMLALLDPLTALPNRLVFDRCLERVLEGGAGTLLYIDLDRFKELNDTHGHAAGDALLRQVAKRLEGVFGGSPSVDELDGTYAGPIVSRRGGDEFTVLIPELDERALAHWIGRVRAVFRAPFHIGGQPVHAKASIGVTHFAAGEASAQAMQRADAALYDAKRGRESIAFFDEEQYAAQRRRRELRDELEGALAAEEFEVVYQPLHAVDGALIGAEALLRWESARFGHVSPADFIPLAEESGTIVPIGAWVLSQACAEAASWPSHVRVSVNVSAVQLEDPGFVTIVQRALESSGLDAGRLELEVTETATARDVERLVARLHALRALGVGLALDDFGTGYSSLSFLRQLPVERLKIDRSFVASMLDDESDAAVVRAIVALGRSLGLRVLAEGVETEAQRDVLASMGCDELQGWLLGRPASAAAMGRRADEPEPSGVRATRPSLRVVAAN